MVDKEIRYTFTATDELTPTFERIKQAQRELILQQAQLNFQGGASATMQREHAAALQLAASRIGEMDQSLGRATGSMSALKLGAAGAGFELLNLGKDALVAGAQFEQTIANIGSIKDIDAGQLSNALTDMATRVPQSAQQLADGLYNLFSSIDISVSDGVKLLEKLARGAVAAQTDTGTFGTAAIGTMNAFKLSVKDADHISDVFFNTVRDGVVTGQELASNLGLVTQQAKNAGLDLNELGAAIVAVTKEGGSASQNINNLSNLLAKLPTKEAQDELHRLGVITTDGSGKFLAFGVVLDGLKGKLDGLNPAARAAELQKLFPDLQARTALITLLSEMDAYGKSFQRNVTEGGSSAAAYGKQVDTLNMKWTQFTDKLGSGSDKAFNIIKVPLEGLLIMADKVADALGMMYGTVGTLAAAAFGNVETSTAEATDVAAKSADDIYATMFGLRDRAAQAGRDVGEGYSKNIADGAGSKNRDIYIEADKHLKTMDISGAASKIGKSVGVGYTDSMASGVAAHRAGLQAEVDKNKAILAGLSGFEPPTRPDPAESAKAAWIATHPMGVTDKKYVGGSPSGYEAYAGATYGQYGSTTAMGSTQAQATIHAAEEARRREALAAARAGLSSANKAATAARKEDTAGDASRQIDQELNLARAKRLVADAQDALNKKTAEYKDKVDTATQAENDLATQERQDLDNIQGDWDRAKQAAQDYGEKTKAALAVIDEKVYQDEKELGRLEAAAKVALKPLIADAERAKTALEALQSAAGATRDGFDATAHGLELALRPLQDELAAEQAAVEGANVALQEAQQHVQDVAAAWDTKLIPAQERAAAIADELTAAQRELNQAQQEQNLADRANRIHDEQQQLDNLAVRIASATGATRQQLELERDRLRTKMGREGRKDAAEDKVAGLTEQQQAQARVIAELEKSKKAAVDDAQEQVKSAQAYVDAAQARVKATQSEISAIELEQQAVLARARADFEYTEKVKEDAAQKDIDRTAAAVTNAQKASDALTKPYTDEIAAQQKARTEKVHDDGIEQTRLNNIATGYEDSYKRVKATYDGQKLDIENLITDLKEQEKQAAKPLEAIVKYFTDNEKTLQAAYQGIKQIDDAIDRGAAITPKMRDALQNFKTEALDLIAGTVDPTKPESLSSKWAAAWNGDKAGSIPKMTGEGLGTMSKGTAQYRKDTLSDLDDVIQKYKDLALQINSMPTYPSGPPVPPKGKGVPDTLPDKSDAFHRAKGGDVLGGYAYLVGERGPELFAPKTSGYVYPTGSYAYKGGNAGGAYGNGGGGGSGMGGAPVFNFNLAFNGAPMISKDQISYTVRRAIDEAMGEHYRQTGRSVSGAVR